MEYSLSIKAQKGSTYVRGQGPKVKKKEKATLYKEAQASGAGLGAEGEEGERTSTGVVGFPE